MSDHAHPESDELIPQLNDDTTAQKEAESETFEDADLSKHFLWFQAAPAWLVSMVVHVLILLVLGLVTIADPIKIVNVLSANYSGEEGPEVEEFTIEEMDPGDISELEEEIVEPVDVAEAMEMVEPTPMDPMEIATVDFDVADFASEMAPAAMSLQTVSSLNMQPMSSRTADMKKKLLRDYGGNESSEAAVTEALKWLSRHQMPNGAWTYQHNLVCNGRCGNPGEPNRAKAFNAATAMGLLPFMGAGQTHKSGEFREVVFRGLRFLVQNGKPGIRADCLRSQ